MFKKSLSILLCLTLVFVSIVEASKKPEIIRCDATYVQQAVAFNIAWLSSYPVTTVTVLLGDTPKVIKVDEYDNTRTRDGYTGEVSVQVPVAVGSRQPSISYVVVLEDELRQKSEQKTGTIALLKRDSRDDHWAEDKVRPILPPGHPPVAEGKSGDIVDKLIDTMQRHDIPPTIDHITVNILSPETANFSTKANDDKGLREIIFKVFDSAGIEVGKQTLTNLGKVWQGTSQTFTLKAGSYKVTAQAFDTAGNASKEQSATFNMVGIALPPPPPPPQPIVSTFTIMATADSNGVIEPRGEVKVDAGKSQTFTIKANAGYRVKDVKVDGISKGAIESYKFGNVQKDGTIHAEFEQLPPPAPKKYTINATAGPNGVIEPRGEVKVDAGKSQTFTIKANAGYRVKDVKVDGISKGAIESYKFENVQKDGTIHAEFELDTGYLIVSVVPQGQVKSARWRVGNKDWIYDDGSATGKKIEIPVGTYTLECDKVEGWQSPNSKQITIKSKTTTTEKCEYSRANYNITTLVTAGVTLNCRPTQVSHGGSSTCTINVSSGYALSSLKDNNQEVKGSISNNQYIVQNVTSNRNLVATASLFKPNVISFTANPSVLNQNDTVTFSVTTDYPADKVVLKFSDVSDETFPMTSTNKTQWSYQKSIKTAGQRTVIANAYNSNNESGNSKSLSLTVIPPIPSVISFTANPSVLKQNDTVTFSVTTDYPADKVVLKFSDVSDETFPMTSTNKTQWSYQKSIKTAGQRTVIANAYNSNNKSGNSKSLSLTVNPICTTPAVLKYVTDNFGSNKTLKKGETVTYKVTLKHYLNERCDALNYYLHPTNTGANIITVTRQPKFTIKQNSSGDAEITFQIKNNTPPGKYKISFEIYDSATGKSIGRYQDWIWPYIEFTIK